MATNPKGRKWRRSFQPRSNGTNRCEAPLLTVHKTFNDLLDIMASKLNIRKETAADIEAISAVTAAAFKDHPISKQTEPFIIRALRAAGALTLSLVAEIDGRVVGHVAFSPVTISDGTGAWYGLGPVSVLQDLQKQGIGKALINEGLSRLKTMGAQGCALIGDPDYYRRFGFRNYPEMVYEGIPQKFFQALPFIDEVPQGIVGFHDGFQATS